MKRQRLHIDYIAPPRRPRTLGFVVLALALLSAGALVERFRAVKTELETIQAGQGLSVERRAPATTSRERLNDEIKATEAVLRQLTLPWDVIIETVESVATPDVAILQMQPEAQQRLLRLSGEARTEQAMLDYLRQLAAAKSLSDAHIVNHQVQIDQPQRPVQFTVQAVLKELR